MPRRQLLFMLALAPLLGAWPGVGQPVGLLEAYQEAVESDPQLAQAAAARQAEQEAVPQARALLLPQLSAGGNLTRTYSDDDFGSDEITSDELGVTLNQSVYNRGNRVRLQQAEFNVEQAEAEFISVQQTLILRVSQNYFNVLAALADLEFARADKAAIARQLEQAKRRFEVGLVTITDVQEAQARFDSAVAQEIQAVNALADAKEALREITGQFYDDFQTLSERMPLAVPEPDDPDAWVQKALDNNPDLISAAYAVDIARENIELQRSDRFPEVDLQATYADGDNGIIDGRIRTSRIGLQVNVPLYTGGAISSRIREAAFQYEAVKEQREELQRAVIRRVRDAYRGLQTDISLIKALDQAQVSARSALEATEAGFEVGTRTIVDVLNAQRDLFRAVRDYRQARYQYVLNWLRLYQAAGEISPEQLQTVSAWLEQ